MIKTSVDKKSNYLGGKAPLIQSHPG